MILAPNFGTPLLTFVTVFWFEQTMVTAAKPNASLFMLLTLFRLRPLLGWVWVKAGVYER